MAKPKVQVNSGNGSAAVQSMLRLADEFLGTPYSWAGGNTSGPTYGTGRGANIKGFDCSSFAQYLYAKIGIDIPRVTYDQVHVGTQVANRKNLDLANLQPGDLLFFEPTAKGPGHVGIYIGDGNFIHAPHTGDVIKISKLTGWYKDNFVMANRVVGPGRYPLAEASASPPLTKPPAAMEQPQPGQTASMPAEARPADVQPPTSESFQPSPPDLAPSTAFQYQPLAIPGLNIPGPPGPVQLPGPVQPYGSSNFQPNYGWIAQQWQTIAGQPYVSQDTLGIADLTQQAVTG